jgi:hypothetical protein
MKLTVNGKTLHVRWNYTMVPVTKRTPKNPVFNENQIQKALDSYDDLTLISEVKTDISAKLRATLVVAEVQKTTCILSAEGKTLAEESVRRYYKDSQSKEEARKISLARLLAKSFPGMENKEIRKNFWDAYNNRGLQTNQAPVRDIFVEQATVATRV